MSHIFLRPGFLHYTLMVLVSLVAVGAFDAVGSILVIAFFIKGVHDRARYNMCVRACAAAGGLHVSAVVVAVNSIT